MINSAIKLVGPDGRPTFAGLQIFEAMTRRLADLEARDTALEARATALEAEIPRITALEAELPRITALETQMTAIAAVADPTGGATTDAEARTAINAIIAAAT